MQLSQRLDQRLHTLRQEVRTMSQENEREERVWRERLQRCQRQLKARDEELSRQSLYFENFKAQLQQKLSLARDREQSLQNRIYTLEKQLLDVTVCSATGMTTITALRITAGTATHMNKLDNLPSMRGEGEGEEEKKEEKRKQWPSNVASAKKERPKVDEGTTETEGGRDKETQHASNEARLQSFIISLQEDLKVLLEREENGMTERRKLLEELQEAQENGYFLGCKVEEMKAELHQLRQSERSLMEEVEELRSENLSLQQILRVAANPTPPLSSLKPEATSTIFGADLPPCSPNMPACSLSPRTAVGQSSSENLSEVQQHADVTAIQPIDLQSAAEYTQKKKEDCFPPAQSKTTKQNDLNLFPHISSNHTLGFQSLSFSSSEFLTEPKLKSVEEIPSEESDALRAALDSLGFGENVKALTEQRGHLEVELQHTKAELQAIAQENAKLKLHLRGEAEQPRAKSEWSSKEKMITPSTCNGDGHLSKNSAEDEAVLDLAQVELIRALNQENQALADRIQELLAHIKLREEEIKTEQTDLRERVCRLQEENREQASLISELTRKTEDDLNTIMDLQQELEESKDEPQVKQHCRTLRQSEHQAGIPRCFFQKKQKECVDSVAESVPKGDKETQLIFSQETDSLTTASLSGCQQNIQHDSSQSHSQNSLHVSSLTDEVVQLNSSIQSLKTEQKELTVNISSLREEQKEVTLSLQRQTEEKQQLTRSVWALKEQKDCIFKSVQGLKQEKEQLNRVVCSLKDERDQYTRSISGLKDETERLINSLSTLQRDKDVIKESISSCEEESERIIKSLQSLRTESEQLRQTVVDLKKLRDELTDSLKSLTEQGDQQQLAHNSKGEQGQLMKSVSSLKEEKAKVEQSIIFLKQEQRNIEQIILGLKEERCSLQTQAEKTNHELTPRCGDMTKRTGKADTPPSCETCNNRGTSLQKESDLMREIETLEAELKKSREEVKELQNKLLFLLREKTDAVSLKAQTEEQYNIVSALLKAKTVALEELNSEYIALKREQGSRDEQTGALVSLRTRYNDIRAKHDAFLKRKNLTDLDAAPLKAKLSCLVVKCQERNGLLAEMMKSMHRQGCLEPRLTQQAERLLRDDALQDYAAAFSPERKIQHREHCREFTQDFFSAFQSCNKGFMPEKTCPVVSSCLIRHQNDISPESGVQCGESVKESLIFASETSTNHQDCFKVSPASAEALKENPLGSTCSSRVTESAVVQLKESMLTDSKLLSPPTGSLEASSRPEKINFPDLEVKDKSSSDTTELEKRLYSPSTASSSTRVSPSRRLSSPEKILNLQEELQRTMDSFQAPEIRGRGQLPRRNLSPSAPTDVHPVKPMRHLSFSLKHTDSLAVSKFSPHSKHTTDVTTKSDTSNKSPTLFPVVTSLSANDKLGPSCHLKADGSEKTELLTSDFSANHRKDSSISSDDTKLTRTKQTRKTITMLDLSNATCTDTFHTSCSQSDRFSHERSHRAAIDSTSALENALRPRPGAPAEVRSVDVIKTVGQSSLLIGWERPPLDELGCSNATFVYGYRVFVNKEFHKSVMSSACTKCILENIDLSVPVHIGVQTLGSNGLHSDSVYIIYPNSEY